MTRRSNGQIRRPDTKQAKLSTPDRLGRLPADIAVIELAYVTVKDRFTFELSRYKQMQQEISDCRDPVRRAELGDKVHGVNGRLVELRRLARVIGEMSFGFAYAQVANAILPPQVAQAIRLHTEDLMGRHSADVPTRKADEAVLIPDLDATVRQLRAVLVDAGILTS